jgi:hypothetical protein
MMNLLERFVVAFESIAKSVEKLSNPVITLEVPPADEHPAGVEGKVAAAEAPKKRRGRPTKAEVAAREAAKALGADEAFSTEAPVCPDCREPLTDENSSRSKVDGRIIHVGCKVEEQKPAEVVKLPVEKTEEPKAELVYTKEMVREKAVAFANRKQREMGDGRGAFLKVLQKVGGWATVNDVPASRYAEIVEALDA